MRPKPLLLSVFLMLTALPATQVSAEHQQLSEAARIAIAHLGVAPEQVRVTDEYTSAHNQVTHVYLRQVKDGLDVAGADATVNIQDRTVIFS
ncbi:MAG TPA: hypothetical protein VG602_07740, partial [Actinomycetota bacterium]|nr:hypothetical protein [Actinomycetota bacterium]